MDDDIGVFSEVHRRADAAIAEVEAAVRRAEESVGIGEIVRVSGDGPVENGAGAREAQRLDLALEGVEVMIDHRLLKAVIVAGVDVVARGLVGLAGGLIPAGDAGRAGVHVLAFEFVLASLDAQKSLRPVLRGEKGGVSGAVAIGRRGDAAAGCLSGSSARDTWLP